MSIEADTHKESATYLLIQLRQLLRRVARHAHHDVLHPPLKIRIVELELRIPCSRFLRWGYGRVQGVVEDDGVGLREEAVHAFGYMLELDGVLAEDLWNCYEGE